MQTLDLIAITSNSDTTEGRGHTIVHGYTDDPGIARAIVQDKRFAKYCVMGVQQPDDYKYYNERAVIKIFDSADEFFNNTKDEIRKRALSKLTAEDRESLGV